MTETLVGVSHHREIRRISRRPAELAAARELVRQARARGVP